MKRFRSGVYTLTILLFSATTVLAAGGGTGVSSGMAHRMMMLVMQLGTIFIAAKIGHVAFEKIKLPGVLGEVVVGIAIGPYLLGAVGLPGLPEGLFPINADLPVSPELYGICSLAAVVLLFMVGLETDMRLFMRYSLAGSLVGIGGVTLSFLMGDALAVAFSRMLFGQPLGFFAPPCLFLGIITTATSVGITARMLSEQRKLDSPEGVTILAGAVIDDVLGIILLAVGLGVISASRVSGQIDWQHIGLIAAKAVGIWLAATVIGLMASRRISTLLKLFKDRSSIAIMALGLALVLAGLFEEAGLAMIIGAYVAGLSLSGTDINQVVRERLDAVYALLVPVFFTVMGMLVDVRQLGSSEVLLFGLLYTAVCVVAKILGCGLPALFTNFNWLGALRIGAGMLPRGEVTLIIAGTGLAAGILTQKLFGVVILMTLASTLLSPPAIILLFRIRKDGLRKPRPAGEGTALSFTFPSARTAELLIGKLLAVFESEGFFVHTLSRREGLYQIRKDRAIISIHHCESAIAFDCVRMDVPLIKTAMYEVLAELEQTINELRKPIDREGITRTLQEALPGDAPANTMAAYLSADLIEPGLKGESKKEIIEELLKMLNRRGKIRDLEGARGAVWRREESMSTGMQHGIAIPHGKTDAVDRLVCAVGIKSEGVDFQSIDGEPTRIIILTLSPLRAPAPHVQFMSTISQVLNAEGRELLLSCRTREDMLAVLAGKGKPSSPADSLWQKFRNHRT